MRYGAVIRQNHLLGSASSPQEKRSHCLYFYITEIETFHPPKIEFPADTEIYGYRVKNGKISLSDHTITSLGKAKTEELLTVRQVNSWKGLYKMLIGHLLSLSNVMSPFDSATSGKNPSEKFAGTPKSSEQLLLLPDAMSTSPYVGWVLYVIRQEKTLPVMYCTTKLKDYMVKWYPCEKVAIGAVLAINQCAHWISESQLTTLVGPDCLAVVKAVDLIKNDDTQLQESHKNLRFQNHQHRAPKQLA